DDPLVLGAAQPPSPFAMLAEAIAPPPDVDIDPAQDLVVLPYSSGTTGFPKGVMLTHRNLVANLIQTSHLQRVAGQDRIIAVLPFFHIYGMTVVLSLGLWRGATLITSPKFELEPFLGLLQAHGVTRAFVVPPLVLALAREPVVDRYDLSGLRA